MKTSKLSLSELSVKSFVIEGQQTSRIYGGLEEFKELDPDSTLINGQCSIECNRG
ncbi:hypothetical protein AB9P05_16155 [Roseivirga sp. BDSF3-8]|uniref:hypothetical protein n=1 Tax=Roseivirga sp. BDSF3-8 TaxID=3241598 RepID=UPI00353225B3